MHRPVKEHLEEFLRAAGPPGDRPETDSHLRACQNCRAELEAMAVQARLVRELRSVEELEAAPGFYARVMLAVEVRESASVLHAFTDPHFGRRFIYACLATILILGSYLVYTERAAPPAAAAPVSFLATDVTTGAHVGTDQQRDREIVLVSLASYRE